MELSSRSEHQGSRLLSSGELNSVTGQVHDAVDMSCTVTAQEETEDSQESEMNYQKEEKMGGKKTVSIPLAYLPGAYLSFKRNDCLVGGINPLGRMLNFHFSPSPS